MTIAQASQIQKRLAEKLAETVKAPILESTPRRVHGVVSLPKLISWLENRVSHPS